MRLLSIALVLLALAGCASTTTYLSFNLQERSVLNGQGYSAVAGEEWMIKGMVEKTIFLQAGRYQIDITKIFDNGKAYSAHIWLWPYVSNNLGRAGAYRHHLEVFRIEPTLTLPEIIRCVNEKVSQIEATYITYGLIMCTHGNDGVLLLTPECYLSRLDSLRQVK